MVWEKISFDIPQGSLIKRTIALSSIISALLILKKGNYAVSIRLLSIPFAKMKFLSDNFCQRTVIFERDSQEDAVDNWPLFTPLQKRSSVTLYFELSIGFCIKWTNLRTKRVPSAKKNTWRSTKPRKCKDFYWKNKQM